MTRTASVHGSGHVRLAGRERGEARYEAWTNAPEGPGTARVVGVMIANEEILFEVHEAGGADLVLEDGTSVPFVVEAFLTMLNPPIAGATVEFQGSVPGLS